MARKRYGKRRYTATFSQHNGKRDSHGNPTVDIPTDWTPVLAGWPCEKLTTRGGETVRGKQVTAQTTHVLFGEFFGANGVNAEMRVMIPGEPNMSVVAAYDPEGTQTEIRIEAKVES